MRKTEREEVRQTSLKIKQVVLHQLTRELTKKEVSK
jgi:hypothetical protein